jgi:hypothetical protein
MITITDLQFISNNWPRKKKETDDSKSKEPMSPKLCFQRKQKIKNPKGLRMAH